MRNSLASAASNTECKTNKTCFLFHPTETCFTRSSYRWQAARKRNSVGWPPKIMRSSSVDATVSLSRKHVLVTFRVTSELYVGRMVGMYVQLMISGTYGPYPGCKLALHPAQHLRSKVVSSAHLLCHFLECAFALLQTETTVKCQPYFRLSFFNRLEDRAERKIHAVNLQPLWLGSHCETLRNLQQNSIQQQFHCSA